MKNLKVGQTIYTFSENNRIYVKNGIKKNYDLKIESNK